VTSNTIPNLTYNYNAPGPGIQESAEVAGSTMSSPGTLAPVTDYGDTPEKGLKSVKTFMEITGTHFK
jgi:hypothetical protein